ncbi:hypothetical protein RB614_06550 [Phytohabitans sp. ZYX-F-186]|uniref:Bypass of forespore C C-terminal domain-containing protein n=1 Tax=Phytohabitans maris TaxID=3071409 RepID=A0ABU0ZAU6_9ACTN|nr:hypothetical protein [Phytohabitans sp. ZYX-F-186]MDQ7904182.1 hypothetical protein [Phytohabitans sp. ZYX-F-186]
MTADATAATDPLAPPPRRRGRARWIAVAVVVVAAAVLAVVLRSAGSAGTSRPPTLRNQLADRIATVLEQSTPADHHGHGHHSIGDTNVVKGPTLCAVRTLGFEPAEAKTAAEVRTVYAYHLCAIVEPGRAWDFAQKLSGPMAVQLTEPMKIEVVEPGLGFQDRVRALIPAPYQVEALKELLDDDQMRDLRERFDEAFSKV